MKEAKVIALTRAAYQQGQQDARTDNGQAEIDRLTRDHDFYRKMFEGAEQIAQEDLLTLRADLVAVDAERDQLKADRDDWRQRAEHRANEADQLQAERDQLRERVAELDTENRQARIALGIHDTESLLDRILTGRKAAQEQIEALTAERDDLMAQILSEPGAADVEALRGQLARQAETIERMGREHDRMIGERDRFLDQKYTVAAERDASHERIRQLDAINAELRAGLDTSKAEPVARLTQDLSDARRETADALHDRDEARTDAAENMALADRRKELLTRQTAQLKEAKASQGRAWAEAERLKGIICNLDRKIAEQQEMEGTT